MRNFFPTYRGPAYSRAGTKFCGYSKQTGRARRPRLVPFQYSISQGLVLEFGHRYMRVLFEGAYVTELGLAILDATRASACEITVDAFGATAAALDLASTTATPYAPGDTITLAGGSYSEPAVLTVTTTKLVSLTSYPAGTGYAPGEVITLAGGTQVSPSTVTLSTTRVAAATVATAGTGGTDGTQTVTGTTGTGTKFQAIVTVAGGLITAVQSISVQGSYTVNPTAPSAEPVTGGGLAGAELALSLAPNTFTLSLAGVFSANPGGYQFTQASTTGAGSGALFISAVLEPYDISISTAGVYAVPPSSPVSQVATSGVGSGAKFNVGWSAVSAYAIGDWVYISGVVGMTELNGQTYVVRSVAGNHYGLADVFGTNLNSSTFAAYVSGGTASRIYTAATIYADDDLDYLKFVESADELTLCCVNQETHVEYVPQNLVRVADDDWTFEPVVPAPSILPPANAPTITVTAFPVAPTAANASQRNAYYQYVVTAINPVNGEESIASPIGSVGSNNTTDISQVLGTATVKWTSVKNARLYNVYKAPVGYGAYAPAGSLFGFAQMTAGTSLLDRNITPDYAQVPPTRENPFARGTVTAVNLVDGGYYPNGATVTINTSTGTGASVRALVADDAVQGFIIDTAGQDYEPTDTVTITGPGGSGATAALVIGPRSGTYPGTVAYFQQRRAYANSLNQPDTYWMSQPGAFKNFDGRTPPIASDAITGSPWATQVNGIQWMIQTSGGLLVMTGLSAWLLVGSGSFATNVQPISPSTQDNVPQAFSGCSPKVFPIKINYDIVYLTSKNSHYYDLPYQLYALSEPIDISDVSSHLFDGYTITDNAWCEQPNKLLWATRNDGVLLSLTYYKTQQIQGWARHDTYGEFVSCASVTELPVDALYVATQRTLNSKTAYMVERMDNRLWQTVENAWCVDCGLSLAQPTPNAVLTISSARGLGRPASAVVTAPGAGYSPLTTATVVDQAGIGTGAAVTLTIVGGAVTAVTLAGGVGYQQPRIDIYDPAGSAGGAGFASTVVLNGRTTLTTDVNVFTPANVGDVVRAGNGIAVITTYVSARNVTANVLDPFPLVPNSLVPEAYAAGAWTLTTPVTRVQAPHLAGVTVTGLADGNVIPPTVADASGRITLATAASAVTVGIGFQAQMQTRYADSGEPTVQGQRKKVAAVTLRLEASRGLKVGANQMDGSTQSPIEVAMRWQQMESVPDTGPSTPNFPLPPYNASAVPLRTGDVRVDVSTGWQTPGQIAVQQDYPLPAQITAVISEVLPGDTPQVQAKQQQRPQQGGQR